MTDQTALLTILTIAAIFLASCVSQPAISQAPSEFPPPPQFPKAIDPNSPLITSVIFACPDQSIGASFFKDHVRINLTDGRTFELPQAISASGARYASPDESIVFWNKGNTAFIMENDKITIDGCVQK